MSLGYPSIVPQKKGDTSISPPQGNYGVQDTMVKGLGQVRSDLTPSHPLEFSESHFGSNETQREYSMLRNTQGLHAPLRLQMERNATKQIQRLPFLPSSNIAYNTLIGRDETIDFEDILNAPGDSEIAGDPHIVMEKRLSIL
ncbi:proteasome maturation protein-like [Saccoglossus kowalevskii]|uniref:Proteasome maturation protein-like n=1 Tax=Saccoglossus kowalevskii TaxID=10224 RepID=A0ABM0MX17_SACKO|nr:PREDICTED: proteasome maturation protein-like [Saccoglossus kowalevskii]